MSKTAVIRVQSADVDLGEALVAHTDRRITEIARRYLDLLTEADVHIRREGKGFECSVRLKVQSLPPFAASETAHDIYRAVNAACEKVAKQLRRKKRALREDKSERVDKTATIDEGLRLVRDDDVIPEPDDYDRAVMQTTKNVLRAAE